MANAEVSASVRAMHGFVVLSGKYTNLTGCRMNTAVLTTSANNQPFKALASIIVMSDVPQKVQALLRPCLLASDL